MHPFPVAIAVRDNEVPQIKFSTVLNRQAQRAYCFTFSKLWDDTLRMLWRVIVPLES